MGKVLPVFPFSANQGPHFTELDCCFLAIAQSHHGSYITVKQQRKLNHRDKMNTNHFSKDISHVPLFCNNNCAAINAELGLNFSICIPHFS